MPAPQPGVGVAWQLVQVAHLHGQAVRPGDLGELAELARGHVAGGDEQQRQRGLGRGLLRQGGAAAQREQQEMQQFF